MEHNGGSPEKDIPRKAPAGIPPEAMPTPEFIEQVKRIEEANKPKPIAPFTVPAPVALPVKQEEPVRELSLEYRYTGSCPSCLSTKISTFIINVDKLMFAIAFCENERKDIMQTPVKPIITKKKGDQDGDSSSKNGVSIPEKVRKMSSTNKRTVQNTA
jgi:hypothetical protein